MVNLNQTHTSLYYMLHITWNTSKSPTKRHCCDNFEVPLEVILSRVLHRNGAHTVHMWPRPSMAQRRRVLSVGLRSLLLFQLLPAALSSLRAKHRDNRDQVFKNYVADDPAKGRRGEWGRKATPLKKHPGRARPQDTDHYKPGM